MSDYRVVRSTVRILIVEDEYVLAANLQEVLESLGYCVTGIATSFSEAITQVIHKQPDLVMMDIRLQGDLDGIHTARFLWQHYRLPSIYLTAHSDPATLVRAQLTLPFGYLHKPVKATELDGAIATALARFKQEGLPSEPNAN